MSKGNKFFKIGSIVEVECPVLNLNGPIKVVVLDVVIEAHTFDPEATNYVYIFYDGYNIFKMSNTEYLEYSYDPELYVEISDVWYDELVYEGTLLTDVEMEEYKELLK